ncbi:hypothetical protein BZG36_03221 [Bifiguratus adelaidae]|uniref:Carboxyvinyl-carboxyphosphonate phosphorylmutase n=1 Tax=Bifiguratus adelaidae TaxID=1938954 RepID=A0A261XWW1_9FUNG|nr:hypothetical protein BZG36_03221 [Bifiguratus adelaidae]
MLRQTTALRRLLAEKRFIYGPGVFDGISVRQASAVGFDFLYMTGSGVAASRIGQADLGITTLQDMAETATIICEVAKVPVVADMDTGFGGPLNITRAIHMYENAGIAGCHIEDQTFPKRCGHLQGKSVVSKEEFIQRIAAAVNARRDPDFVIIARTDAYQPHGFDNAVECLEAAFKAGADMGFFEGCKSREDSENVIRAFPCKDMLLNVPAFGDTPNFNVKEIEDMGYKMAIFSQTGKTPMTLAAKRAYETLKREGSDASVCEGYSPKAFFTLNGLAEAIEIDKKAGGKALDALG